jgi:serine/threonine protein kinase
MASRFGKFSLLQRIGGGRLSQVYRVTPWWAPPDEREGPPVALKRVQPALIAEPAFVQLVVREAGLLARLRHSSLCECQELGVIDGCAFLTLDLVDGCTLRALMRRLSRLQVTLPPSAVTTVACKLAAVLEYLHTGCDTPLVHLDLSPQNVMLDRDGDLRLIDFGIARYLDGKNPPPLGGKIAGTVGYMSPEQATGEELDPRADQYGLGILLWEMLSGQRLYRGNTRETWRRMRMGEVPPAREALKSTPEPLARAVTRLLAPDPDRRFASMTAAREALEQTTSDPISGLRPLSALVRRWMEDTAFDPFDVVRDPDPVLEHPGDIPTGAPSGEFAYDDISIEVDHGEGTPGALVRAAVTESGGESGGGEAPVSPFLETIPEARATAEIAR